MRESEERRHQPNCGVWGCSMLGVYSSSTTGDHKWRCFLHFRSDPQECQNIADALDTHAWLASLVRGMRTARLTNTWIGIARSASQTCADHGRADLQPARGESAESWIYRMECALHTLCAGPAKQAPEEFTATKEAMQRVSFDMPGDAQEAA